MTLVQHDDLLERFADLIVGFGANVQPGQVVAVSSELGKEALTRAIAASAYRRGARFVDVSYFDPYVKRARILHAPEDTLRFVPPWYGARLLALGECRGASVALTGTAAPHAFDDLDPARLGQDHLPAISEAAKLVNERLVNWTAAPCPTEAWASVVHPQLDPASALDRLWQQLLVICRLDAEDPLAAWGERMDEMAAVAERLTALQLDRLRFEGPGTDLDVGLVPGARWISARFTTADGIRHVPNVPSEETFSAPDPRRVDGVVRATKPLVIRGTIIRDLVIRFEAGRVVELDASSGAEVLRTIIDTDEGAGRLGEVALVDRHGRIGAQDTVFYDTLLDENAASHLALGSAFAFVVPDDQLERINDSAIHIDFMIGADDVAVSGVTGTGEQMPILRGGDWQI